MARVPKEVKKYIDQIAGKLLAEDLTYSTYTKEKAKRKTQGVVAQKFVHKMINEFSPEIKAAMKRMSR